MKKSSFQLIEPQNYENKRKHSLMQLKFRKKRASLPVSFVQSSTGQFTAISHQNLALGLSSLKTAYQPDFGENHQIMQFSERDQDYSSFDRWNSLASSILKPFAPRYSRFLNYVRQSYLTKVKKGKLRKNQSINAIYRKGYNTCTSIFGRYEQFLPSEKNKGKINFNNGGIGGGGESPSQKQQSSSKDFSGNSMMLGFNDPYLNQKMKIQQKYAALQQELQRLIIHQGKNSQNLLIKIKKKHKLPILKRFKSQPQLSYSLDNQKFYDLHESKMKLQHTSSPNSSVGDLALQKSNQKLSPGYQSNIKLLISIDQDQQ